MLHEETLREQYITLLAAFSIALPQTPAPDSSWWALWMSKYEFADIRDAITILARHPSKSQFSKVSAGRALSALLREAAIKRAIASVQTPKGQS